MIQSRRVEAMALVKGGEKFPLICGQVFFFQTRKGVIVRAKISHLPDTKAMFYGFHIHEGGSCEGEGFPKTGGHYDMENNPHPEHMGDMPPLISSSGEAYMEFLTNRFCLREIIGKTVVIHGGTDDFRTQPSGDAGEKIACGVIKYA